MLLSTRQARGFRGNPKYALPSDGTGIQAVYYEEAQEPRDLSLFPVRGPQPRGQEAWILSPPQDPSFPREEEPKMQRGAEPWNWVLETSSAGSHDFHPGVVLRREALPHPHGAGPHVPPGSLFSLPCLGLATSLPAV